MVAVRPDDLRDIDAIGQAALVRSGELRPLDLVDAAIARIEATRELNAVIEDLFASARREATMPLPDGPLAGVPFLVKDLGGAMAGVPERMGSVALRDHVPSRDAWLVQRYREAGLLICGRTNTPEWGNHCTTARQPSRPDLLRARLRRPAGRERRDRAR